MNDNAATVTLPVNVEQIQQLLPHRYPFPGHPVMPGVLIVEAMAQAAGLLTQLSNRMRGNTASPLFYLVKVDNARFSAPVVPGDQLRLEVSVKRVMRGMGLFAARTLVDGKEVASCELMCAARSDK